MITVVSDDVVGITGNLSNGGSTNDAMPTLTITAEAGSTVKVYDGGTLLGSATETGNRTGVYTYTTTSLNNGSHSFSATATDASNNTSVASSDFVVSVDTTPPVAGTLTLADKADDSDGAFSLVLNGQETGSTVVYQVSTNGGASWTTTTAAQSLQNAGTYQFRAQVTDAVGNTSISSALSGFVFV